MIFVVGKTHVQTNKQRQKHKQKNVKLQSTLTNRCLHRKHYHLSKVNEQDLLEVQVNRVHERILQESTILGSLKPYPRLIRTKVELKYCLLERMGDITKIVLTGFNFHTIASLTNDT